jgi:hypothetical protein
VRTGKLSEKRDSKGSHISHLSARRYLLAIVGTGCLADGLLKFYDHYISKYNLGPRSGGFIDADFMLSYACVAGGILLILFALDQISAPTLQQVLQYSLPVSFIVLGSYKIITKLVDKSYNIYDITLSLAAIFIGIAFIGIIQHEKRRDAATELMRPPPTTA